MRESHMTWAITRDTHEVDADVSGIEWHNEEVLPSLVP